MDRADRVPQAPPLGGIQPPTPVGAGLFAVAAAFALFYYSTPVTGPRVGRTLAILGPRSDGARR